MVHPDQQTFRIYGGVHNAHGSNEGEERNKIFKIKFPIQIYKDMATVVDVEVGEEDVTHIEEVSRTDLDSHANMPVLGRHPYIISDTGQVVDVRPFTPDYAFMQHQIVDAAVQYDCPYNGESYILVIRNTIYIPSIRNNLLPPLVLCDTGTKLNDMPKIQVDEPTI